MTHEPIFSWDNGLACCLLTDGKNVYTGTAQCHPDDEDMMSEKTGCEIAFRRAKIHALIGYRDEVKANLKALSSLYYSMNQSKRYNSNGYEAKTLTRKIKMLKEDLAFSKELIADERKSLRDYLAKKDDFYRKVRERRGLANND